MLREYFLSSADRGELVFAWFGLLVIVANSLFSAYIKFAVNRWYSGFYDLLQESGASLAVNSTTAAMASEHFTKQRQQVWQQLMQFIQIVLPAVVISPTARWIRSNWALRWRLALMRSYTAGWDPNIPPIEGASQRLHEDTQRFANGVNSYLSVLLNSLTTLAAFTPILFSLGARVLPPYSVLRPLGQSWMFTSAAASAAVGLGVAMIAGRKLVGLEVDNQRVEADLRRDLVVLEVTPESICELESQGHNKGRLRSAAQYFMPLWRALSQNYRALFANFLGLNLWLEAFDQIMVLAPYVLVAPMLFAESPTERITLGTLVQASNSFDKVFTSLSIVSENWGGINEWRSTFVRLRQFEDQLHVAHGLGRPSGHKVDAAALLPLVDGTTGSPAGSGSELEAI